MAAADNHSDIHEIHQLLARYVIAIDSIKPELLSDCFTKDAEIFLGGVEAATVEDYKKLCATALPALDGTHHHLSLPAVKVEGDRAISRCYFTAQHVKNSLAPEHSFLIAGWYDDELVRQGGAWRIARRRGTPVWSSGNPAVLGYDAPTGAAPRGPGHSAPDWLV
jgi:hypothetical protein